MRLQIPRGRHVFAAILIALELPVLALLVGAAVTGAIYRATLLADRLRARGPADRRRGRAMRAAHAP